MWVTNGRALAPVDLLQDGRLDFDGQSLANNVSRMECQDLAAARISSRASVC